MSHPLTITEDPIKIVELHGFNVRDKGVGSIGKLRPYLLEIFPNAIYDADSADYGWDFLLKANYLYWTGNTIDRIANALKDADLVICHSNGANYCMKALSRIHNPKLKIVFLSPALNRDYKFNETFQKCLVMYSQDDKTVYWAKWVPLSRWGDMGKVGPTWPDFRLLKRNLSKEIMHHSDWFIKKHIQRVANTIGHFYGET